MRSRKHKRDGVMSHRRRHRKTSVSQHQRRRNRTKKQTKEFHIPKPDSRIKPGDDFYKHINSKWLRHIHMPAYSSSYGVSEEIETAIENELETILYSALAKVRAEEDVAIDHNTTLLGTYMNSALHTSSQRNNVEITKKMVGALQCMRDCADVCSTLGDSARHRVRTGLLQVGVGPRETDVRHLHIILRPGELGLPDSTYYLDKTPSMMRTLNAYVKLLGRLGADFGVEGMENIIGLEFEAAKVLKKTEDEREELMSGRTLERRYPHLCWDRFIKTALNMTTAVFHATDFVVISPMWLSALDKWCKTLTVEQWRVWLAAQTILYNLPYLPPPYDDLHFEFYGARLRDQTEKLPQKKLALYSAQQWLAAPLGDAYIKNFTDPATKKHVETVAAQIIDIAADRLAANKWLARATRREAVKKIRDITVNISHPVKSDLDYLKTVRLSSKDFIKNIYTLGAAELQRDLGRAGKLLDKAHWDEAVYMVNAFYYPEGNRLIMPAGIIRYPFYSEKDDALAYGALGSTIGHEITHAFDVDGKDYDSDGNYGPWWTAADNAHYMKFTQKLVRQYEASSYFGKTLNGELTLSENIADIGGLSFALEAYKKKMGTDLTDEHLRRFFEAYAVSWRTKERREKALQGLFMDTHSPPVLRVNNVVRHFDDWYRVFGVEIGDALYLDPQDRLHHLF